MGYRRRSRSRKAGTVYMLVTPKLLPAIVLGDGVPTIDIVKDLVAKAQAEIAAEKSIANKGGDVLPTPPV